MFDYEAYEKMAAETQELLQRMARSGMIANVCMALLLAAMAALAVVVIAAKVSEHRETMRQLKAQREWQDMQTAMGRGEYDRAGNQWYRM